VVSRVCSLLGRLGFTSLHSHANPLSLSLPHSHSHSLVVVVVAVVDGVWVVSYNCSQLSPNN
jgi:hypothetical protein